MAAILLGILIEHTVSATDFGIGFNLNFDCATSSALYANGTSSAIAKSEGGTSCKRMMRNLAWEMPGQQYPHSHQERTSPTLRRAFNFELQGVRDHLPPWLGGRVPNEHEQLLKAMLQSLKSTAEVFTEIEVQDVTIVFPGMPSQELFKTTNSATDSAELRMPDVGHSCASSMAIHANRWADLGHGWIDEKECHEWRTGPVLAVDYTRAALAVSIYAEECVGLFEGIRGFQETDLGKDAASWTEVPAGRERAVAALCQLIRMPAVTDEGNVLNHIHGAALSGEAGFDEVLRSILLQSEPETVNVSASAIQDNSLSSGAIFDPLNASAIGSAAICWGRLEWQETTEGRLELR